MGFGQIGEGNKYPHCVKINSPSSGVLAVLCHAGLDPASSSVLVWIPASAGMTNSRQAAGNQPVDIEDKSKEKTLP
jgi:hypothetical protein